MSTDFRELIPHRPPMVMIDQVIEYGAQRIVARRAVHQGQPFVHAGRLDEAALVEVIAQTMAAGDAMYAKSRGGEVLRGYLTGLTGLRLSDRARVGETIEVAADCLKRMDGMGLFTVTATAGGRVIAEGRFKLYVEVRYGDKVLKPDFVPGRNPDPDSR
jgi:predicted hotdog family 3-hydroxylacyl-ACP dehydratase